VASDWEHHLYARGYMLSNQQLILGNLNVLNESPSGFSP
jgi:hypothetical protein